MFGVAKVDVCIATNWNGFGIKEALELDEERKCLY
jgi:hypothetical protein